MTKKKRISRLTEQVYDLGISSSLLIEEVEDYRDLFMNSEDDFNNIRVQYTKLKATVIRVFNENKRLKARNLKLEETHKMDKIIRFGALYGMSSFRIADMVKAETNSNYLIEEMEGKKNVH